MLRLVLALVPVAVLLWWLMGRDRNREPTRVVLMTLLLGAITPIPIVLVALPLAWMLGISHQPSTFGEAVAASFILAALVEEVFKFLVLWGYSARHSQFDEPFDGIVYGTTASLGFAASENVMYVFGGQTEFHGYVIGFLRAFTAVPMHAMCGVTMGICIGIAKFSPRRAPLWLGLGLAGAIGLHGTYNSFAFGSQIAAQAERGGLLVLSMGGFLATTVLAAIICLLAIARMRRDQVVAAVAGLPAGAPPPSEAARFLSPLPPPPPRVGVVVPPPSPIAVAAPPWLPMLAMILEAIAAAAGVILLGIGVVYAEAESDAVPDAVGLLACSLFGIAGLLSLAGIAVGAAALARRDRWPGASVGAIVTGSLLVLVFGAILLVGILAS